MRILSMPLIQKSRKVVFVNSASKDNCVSMPNPIYNNEMIMMRMYFVQLFMIDMQHTHMH